jgi:muconolactone delta-isomerase
MHYTKMVEWKELLRNVPKYVPQPESVTVESLESMIEEMREHLQQGFGLLESVWVRVLNNRDIARQIEDLDEFKELLEGLAPVQHMAEDITQILDGKPSFTDRPKNCSDTKNLQISSL